MTLTKYRETIDSLLADHRLFTKQVDLESTVLDAVKKQTQSIEEAQQIAQHVAQAIQQRAHNQIASVVSRCLAAIFDDPYTFTIRFDRKRGKTEAVLLLEREGQSLDDPLNSVGGGVIDVAAMALRLACVMLARPSRRKLLILDEPFRFLAKCYRGRARAMLGGLAEDMGFQFVIVTHMQEFAMGKVIELDGS